MRRAVKAMKDYKDYEIVKTVKKAAEKLYSDFISFSGIMWYYIRRKLQLSALHRAAIPQSVLLRSRNKFITDRELIL